MPSVRAAARPDHVLADFEADSYGDWSAAGDCFGEGPAHGTLANQQHVSGFLGHGLVNTYLHGDRTTGTLTSPAFTIDRHYINVLIGGGNKPGLTCINLIVDGKIARTATGRDDEHLAWETWNLSDLAGRSAVIQIVDHATGQWGHINIDQIVASDTPRVIDASRSITIDKHYLLLPIHNGAAKQRMTLKLGDQLWRSFEIELAPGKPDFWAFVDVSSLRGKSLRIGIDRMTGPADALDAIHQADVLPDADAIYTEAHRPQFHFTSRRGWLNDPNGLVFDGKQYHLFYQHNPFGTQWGNMTWGHAVSTDLLHWHELDSAITPDALGTIFSGSAVIDHTNSLNLPAADAPALVCFYTAAGGTNALSAGKPFTQCMAYSTDGGRTFTKFADNPVLAHIIGGNRDPKVIRYEPGHCWIMALFLDGHTYGLFRSTDLRHWKQIDTVKLENDGECPDFFELPIDGHDNDRRWVFWGASGHYLIGHFDGEHFTAEGKEHRAQFGPSDYAAQTYSNIPAADGRRIQVAWMRGGRYPEMPFNQQMSIPRRLTLRTTPDGVRLFINPVREVESLREPKLSLADRKLDAAANPLSNLHGEQWDIDADVQLDAAQRITLNVCGFAVTYDAAKSQLQCGDHTAPLSPVDGRIRLRVLVDRTSVEVFANHGRVQMAAAYLPDAAQSLSLHADGGAATLRKLDVYGMRSAWPQH